jgi:DNA-binding CsgD family transcriptional regulator
MLQCGEHAQADQVLSPLADPAGLNPIDLPALLDARAQLRLAQARPGEALADAVEAGRRSETHDGPAAPGAVAWRSTAALAHLALGDRPAARRLASEELRLARASGVTRLVVRNLRVLGLAERRERRLALLEEAVEIGDAGPTRLEHILALVDFGSALCRANRRTAARAPLRRALELSHRGGIRDLAERAHEELIASGARPRRARTTGPESLTPSERRVAELAARGLTTRQIAAALFVSPKTVEFHLRHVYEKLAVASSRFELARAMRAARLDARGADGGHEPVLDSPPPATDSRPRVAVG